jgi:hypothetical protein
MRSLKSLSVVLALELSTTFGCGDGARGAGSAAPSASAPPKPSAAPAASEPERPPPDDLDLAPLEKALGCNAKSTTGPCKIVLGMKTCKPWAGVAPSGEGRWFGKSYAVSQGKTTESYVVLRSRSVPSSEVGRGQLPARIAIDPIAAEGTMAQAAERALNAYARHDVPTKGNPFPPLVKEKSDFTEASAMPTVKKAVVVLGAEQTFVCEGDGQELYAITPAASGGQKGDGRYAEVWPTTW